MVQYGRGNACIDSHIMLVYDLSEGLECTWQQERCIKASSIGMQGDLKRYGDMLGLIAGDRLRGFVKSALVRIVIHRFCVCV